MYYIRARKGIVGKIRESPVILSTYFTSSIILLLLFFSLHHIWALIAMHPSNTAVDLTN